MRILISCSLRLDIIDESNAMQFRCYFEGIPVLVKTGDPRQRLWDNGDVKVPLKSVLNI